MDFSIHANGLGKHVRVYDRIGGSETFNQFVDRDNTVAVTVASNDGESGNVDIYAKMRANSPEIAVQTDYDVRKDETIEIDDQ